MKIDKLKTLIRVNLSIIPVPLKNPQVGQVWDIYGKEQLFEQIRAVLKYQIIDASGNYNEIVEKIKEFCEE